MGQLQERIVADLATSITNRDNVTRDYLKVVVAELSRGKFQEKTDEETLQILTSMKKQATLLTEMSGISFKETKLLDLYLPKTMSFGEMRYIVETIVKDKECTKQSDLGKVMKELAQYGPTLDKKYCSEYSKELISAGLY